MKNQNKDDILIIRIIKNGRTAPIIISNKIIATAAATITTSLPDQVERSRTFFHRFSGWGGGSNPDPQEE